MWRRRGGSCCHSPPPHPWEYFSGILMRTASERKRRVGRRGRWRVLAGMQPNPGCSHMPSHPPSSRSRHPHALSTTMDTKYMPMSDESSAMTASVDRAAPPRRPDAAAAPAVVSAVAVSDAPRCAVPAVTTAPPPPLTRLNTCSSEMRKPRTDVQARTPTTRKDTGCDGGNVAGE